MLVTKNGQNRHQHLKVVISSPTSVTNIDVAEFGSKRHACREFLLLRDNPLRSAIGNIKLGLNLWFSVIETVDWILLSWTCRLKRWRSIASGHFDLYPHKEQCIKILSCFCCWNEFWFKNIQKLRVVQTQIILFLKSMSERCGSDKERLWFWMTPSSIDFESV